MNQENDPRFEQLERDARKLADSVSRLVSGSSAREEKFERLERAKETAQEKFQHAREIAREKGKKVDRYAHENVWKTVGIATAIGVIAGMLASKLKRDKHS